MNISPCLPGEPGTSAGLLRRSTTCSLGWQSEGNTAAPTCRVASSRCWPSEGLAPTIVDVLVDAVHHLVEEGVAVLVVEQNLRAAVRMAERQLVMVSGRIEAEFAGDELTTRPDLQHRYLGVGTVPVSHP